MIEVRRLITEELDMWRNDLADVLEDCVLGGASVHFMLPFTRKDALHWWDGCLAGIKAGKGRIFGAIADGKLVGTVQLGLDNPPNQFHKGEIKKMLVHRAFRRQGLAKQLLEAAEAEARVRRLTLLVLDTNQGSEAEALYVKMGYQRAGVIPDFAKWPDGRPSAAVFFWKALT